MKKKLLFWGICFILCGMLIPSAKVSAQELEEHTAHITDPELSGLLEEMVGSLYETMSTAYTINWTVKKGKYGTTAYFKKTAGSSVGISIDLSGYGYAGVMDMDGNARYVAGTKGLVHNFAISKTYYYCFFVKNQSTGSITAKGHYIK